MPQIPHPAPSETEEVLHRVFLVFCAWCIGIAFGIRLLTWRSVILPRDFRPLGFVPWEHHVRANCLLQGFPTDGICLPLREGAPWAIAGWGAYDLLLAITGSVLEFLGFRDGVALALSALPPVLGALALMILVGAMYRAVGRWAAAGAAMAGLALPGAHLWSSMLGAGTSESAQTLLLAILIAVLLMSIRSDFMRWVLGIVLAIAGSAWSAGVQVVLLYLLATWAWHILARWRGWEEDVDSRLPHVLAAAAGICAIMGSILPAFSGSWVGPWISALLLAGASAWWVVRDRPHILPNWSLDLLFLWFACLTMGIWIAYGDLGGADAWAWIRRGPEPVPHFRLVPEAGGTWGALGLAALGVWQARKLAVMGPIGILLAGVVLWVILRTQPSWLLVVPVVFGIGMLVHHLRSFRARSLFMAGILVLGVISGGGDLRTWEHLRQTIERGHAGPAPEWFRVLDQMPRGNRQASVWFELLGRIPAGGDPILGTWEIGWLAAARSMRPVLAAGSPDPVASGMLMRPLNEQAWLSPSPDKAPLAEWILTDDSLLTRRFRANFLRSRGIAPGSAGEPEGMDFMLAWRNSLAARLHLDDGGGISTVRLVDEAGPARLVGLVRLEDGGIRMLDRELKGEDELLQARQWEEALISGPVPYPEGGVLLHGAVRPTVRLWQRVPGAVIQGRIRVSGNQDLGIRARARILSEASGATYTVHWAAEMGNDGFFTVRVPYEEPSEEKESADVWLTGPYLVQVRPSGQERWLDAIYVRAPAGSATRGDVLEVKQGVW